MTARKIDAPMQEAEQSKSTTGNACMPEVRQQTSIQTATREKGTFKNTSVGIEKTNATCAQPAQVISHLSYEQKGTTYTGGNTRMKEIEQAVEQKQSDVPLHSPDKSAGLQANSDKHPPILLLSRPLKLGRMGFPPRVARLLMKGNMAGTDPLDPEFHL